MAAHNELGKTGETLAAAYLKTIGYLIICQNWRYAHFEIDIIATKGRKLHFIEVKTRRSAFYGYPEESVTKRKFNYLKNAADEYLHQNAQYKWIQYDVLSIIFRKNGMHNFFLLEDVYL